MDESTGEWERCRGRDLLDVAHLDCSTFPGGQYLLYALARESITLRDPIAAPSEKEIQLYGLPLYIGAVVFREDRYLRRKADAVLANSAPEFTQAELLNLLRGRTWTGSIDRAGCRLYCKFGGNARNRNNSSRHRNGLFL